MPTPSSNRDNDSLPFSSTCPDEQAPRQPTSWSQLSPPFEETSGAGSSDASSIDTTPILPRLPPAIAPDAPPSSDGAAATPLGPDNDDDDDAKPTDAADQTMADTNAAEARAAAEESHREPAARSSGPTIARAGTGDSETWEPYGVSQALRRQLDGGSFRPFEMSSPVSMDSDKMDEHAPAEAWDGYTEGCRGFDPTSLRIIPVPPSTYLRPGSRFVGTQQSERQEYAVEVEIKHVDLRESFLCGYLRIQGLTEDHPTLTTYFEGEIIGSKYGFTTKHKSWGASDRIDMSHWAKFAAFHPFVRQAKKGSLVIKEYLQKENIFMRWKEQFLVPDHRVRTIHGASYEGFYYICFNQVEGVVHGIYFHSKSEKFQQLELKHVEDRGCMSAVEFR